jgi:hypothetical protein
VLLNIRDEHVPWILVTEPLRHVSWTWDSNHSIFIFSESGWPEIISNRGTREGHQRDAISTGTDTCKKGQVSAPS